MNELTCEEQILQISQAFTFYYQETNAGCRNSIIPMVTLVSEIEKILGFSRDTDEEER
jgi:hypothetical protein